ncbi:MAG: hypothetical protein NT034_03530, partial [Candidatus Magasanikbacteria bacterium]|nr:hypothetical protein [Candidatus Magasanikbacteria bacterium]
SRNYFSNLEFSDNLQPTKALALNSPVGSNSRASHASLAHKLFPRIPRFQNNFCYLGSIA